MRSVSIRFNPLQIAAIFLDNSKIGAAGLLMKGSDSTQYRMVQICNASTLERPKKNPGILSSSTPTVPFTSIRSNRNYFNGIRPLLVCHPTRLKLVVPDSTDTKPTQLTPDAKGSLHELTHGQQVQVLAPRERELSL